MTLPLCIELPTPPALPNIEIPQFGILEVARKSLHDLPDPSAYLMALQDSAALALAPLRRFLELMEIILSIKDCFSVLPDSLLPPDPEAVLDCIKNLVKAIARLAMFFPPLSYIPTVLSVMDFVILTVDEVISLFVLLDQRISYYKSVLNTAISLGDLELAAFANCGSAEVRIQIINSMDILMFVSPLAEAILRPLIRLLPGSGPIKDRLEDIAATSAAISGIKDDIVASATLPVLEPLLQQMTILRNAAVFLYNKVAPIVGRPTDRTQRDIPILENL